MNWGYSFNGFKFQKNFIHYDDVSSKSYVKFDFVVNYGYTYLPMVSNIQFVQLVTNDGLIDRFQKSWTEHFVDS